MIKFQETKDGYIFSKDDQHLAIGIYESGSFHLLHNDKMLSFSNAMLAFSYLGNIYEPRQPKAKTLEMFTTPSRAIDNMSRFKDNPHLKGITKEEFHAYLPN